MDGLGVEQRSGLFASACAGVGASAEAMAMASPAPRRRTHPSPIYTPSNSITKPVWVPSSTTVLFLLPTSPSAAQASIDGTFLATLLPTLGGMTSPPEVQYV